jgi:hypothetical protein
MRTEQSLRRLPLPGLLADTQRRTAELMRIAAAWRERVAALAALSRPHRKRSTYPNLLKLRDALQKGTQAGARLQRRLDFLARELEELRAQAERVRASRLEQGGQLDEIA